MSLEWSENPVFTVKSASGVLSLLPKTRNYQFVLRGYSADISVKTLVDGNEIAAECMYDADTHSVVVKLAADITSEIKLMISGASLITDNGNAAARMTNLLQKVQLNTGVKNEIMHILEDANRPMNHKLFEVTVRCANGIEYNDLIEAIAEQVTLIEE